MKNIFLIINFILVIATTSFAVWRIQQALIENRRYENDAYNFGDTQADQVAQAINAELRSQMAVVDQIAADLSSGDLAYKDISARIREQANNKSNIYGLGAAFEPYAYKPDIRQFESYYYKNAAGEFVRAPDKQYDYTNAALGSISEWYTGTMRLKKPRWLIYTDPAATTKLVEYSAPFFDPNDQTKVMGVVYIDHSLDTLRTFMRQVDVGEEGYSFILANTGEVVIHPSRELQGKKVDAVAVEINDPGFVGAFQKASAGESFDTEQTGQRAAATWTFYRPLVAEGWSIATAIKKNAKAQPSEVVIAQQLYIGLIVMIALFCFAALLFRLDKWEPRNLWLFTIAVALIFFGEIAWVWSVVHANPLKATNQEVLTSQANVDAVWDEKLATGLVKEPIMIPTGVIIKSITVGTREATLSGYIWQKFEPGITPDETGGISFPDQLSGATISPAYSFRQGNTTIVGWFFIVTINQDFDLTRYPFDQANIILPIWPRNLNQNVVFVPDFESYDFLAPSEKPGLDKSINLSGWSINRSFFSYRNEGFNADFGGASEIQRNALPTLVFNIDATRNLLSPLIAYCITAFVVSAMLFGILMVNIESAYNALANASALFFVVAITHVGLRSALNASGVVYLEYIFIIQYLFILGNAVNGMLYYSQRKFSIIHYMDNLIIRLAYWPGLLLILLLITLSIFYPVNMGVGSQAVSPAEATGAPATITPLARITPTQAAVSGLPTTTASNATPLPPRKILFGEDTVTLRIPIYTLPTLDPSLTNQLSSTEQINNLFVGLTRLVPATGEIVPSLAFNWKVSEDGLSWTFILRRDISWVEFIPATDGPGGEARQVTDFEGRPRYVNAYDVVYGIQRTLTSANPSAGLLHIIANAKEINTGKDADGKPTKLTLNDLGVYALDEWTVRFTLQSTAPYFPELLAYDISYPVPAWAIQDLAADWTKPGNINTNGPYMLAAYEPGVRMALVRNPFWVDVDQVQIEWVEEPIVTDRQQLLRMYNENLLDTIARPDQDSLTALRSDATVLPDLVPYTTLCVQYLGFVNTKPPFDDIRVRKAFALAIDRQFIVDNILKDGSLAANVFAPPGVFGAVTDPEVGVHYDSALAKALLQAYLDERGLTIADFNNAYQISMGQIELGDTVNQAILQMWKKTLGVDIALHTETELSFFDKKTNPVQQVYHIYQGNWCADYPDQDNFIRFLFNSQSGSNGPRRNCVDATCSGIKNPDDEFDRLTFAALRTTDPIKRQELYAQAELILIEQEMAITPIFWGASIDLTKPWLTRNYPKLGGFDFYNWVIDVKAQIR
jgi:oligopeptide transport system substrate-binding protein